MAARQNGATFVPDDPLDRGDSRPRIVLALHLLAELGRPAVARGVGEEPAAALDVEGRGRLGVLVSPEQKQRERNREGDKACEREQEKASGPPWRTARRSGILPYLIWNFACPVETLPLMSVAIHRKVVVVLTTNDCPGSRGPVESHSVEDDVGFEPSVV